MRRINSKRRRRTPFFIVALFLLASVSAQTLDEEKLSDKQTSAPKSIDFSKMFEEEKTSREDLEKLKEQKEASLRQLMSQPAAIEKAVDPQTYIVGPGDVFSFNVWGPMETQYPVMVNPEGKLLMPSVGEIMVTGKRLIDVQNEVIDKAKSYYKCAITLSLETLRYFRVHVVGEVKYPGTYVAQATRRISEMINEAGGVTDWADRGKIILHRAAGDSGFFDLNRFECSGNMTNNLFVDGGDLIVVPPLDLNKPHVTVEGNFDVGGIYQISEDEDLLPFLQRIKALSKNTTISKIFVLRNEIDSSQNTYFRPYEEMLQPFPLQSGDRIVCPSVYVYVKGAVRNPGAYPYIQNLTTKDYAGMAGGDFQSGSIKNVKVYNPYSGKTKKGMDVLVEPGAVVDLPKSWGMRFTDYVTVISTVASLILAAKAAGAIK